MDSVLGVLNLLSWAWCANNTRYSKTTCAEYRHRVMKARAMTRETERGWLTPVLLVLMKRTGYIPGEYIVIFSIILPLRLEG